MFHRAAASAGKANNPVLLSGDVIGHQTVVGEAPYPLANPAKITPERIAGLLCHHTLALHIS